VSEKKSDIEQVAERLGMKPSEVTEVVVDADGVLAQTKDEKWTLIRDNGVMEFNVPGPDADDAEVEPKKAAPAPKGRS
jgi:hypothetical protein